MEEAFEFYHSCADNGLAATMTTVRTGAEWQVKVYERLAEAA